MEKNRKESTPIKPKMTKKIKKEQLPSEIYSQRKVRKFYFINVLISSYKFVVTALFKGRDILLLSLSALLK